MSKESDLEKVKSLRHGECCNIHWLSGGGSEVHKIQDTYLLFQFAIHDGSAEFIGGYDSDDAVAVVDKSYSFT